MSEASGDVRAVLWDMDGTLIDSADLHWMAWRETMAAEGVAITHEQFLASFGQRNDSILASWMGDSIDAATVVRIGDEKEQRYRKLVRERGISFLPGVAEWVRRLHEEKWRQAIASAAPRANIDVILETLNAARFFQGIAAAEDVSKGKPDPEVFLTAAAKVGVRADRCIVVEDAPAGIQGARKAGMRSIGVGRGREQLTADIVVASLDQLNAEAFEELLKR